MQRRLIQSRGQVRALYQSERKSFRRFVNQDMRRRLASLLVRWPRRRRCRAIQIKAMRRHGSPCRDGETLIYTASCV